jgi:hypothetical protein
VGEEDRHSALSAYGTDKTRDWGRSRFLSFFFRSLKNALSRLVFYPEFSIQEPFILVLT